MKTKLNKNLMCLITILSLIISLCACSNSNVNNSDTSSLSSDSNLGQSNVDSKSNESNDSNIFDSSSLIGTSWAFSEMKKLDNDDELNFNNDEEDIDNDIESDYDNNDMYDDIDMSTYDNIFKTIKITFIDDTKCIVSIDGEEVDDLYEINDNRIDFDDLDVTGIVKNNQLQLKYESILIILQKQ